MKLVYDRIYDIVTHEDGSTRYEPNDFKSVYELANNEKIYDIPIELLLRRRALHKDPRFIETEDITDMSSARMFGYNLVSTPFYMGDKMLFARDAINLRNNERKLVDSDGALVKGCTIMPEVDDVSILYGDKIVYFGRKCRKWRNHAMGHDQGTKPGGKIDTIKFGIMARDVQTVEVTIPSYNLLTSVIPGELQYNDTKIERTQVKAEQIVLKFDPEWGTVGNDYRFDQKDIDDRNKMLRGSPYVQTDSLYSITGGRYTAAFSDDMDQVDVDADLRVKRSEKMQAPYHPMINVTSVVTTDLSPLEGMARGQVVATFRTEGERELSDKLYGPGVYKERGTGSIMEIFGNLDDNRTVRKLSSNPDGQPVVIPEFMILRDEESNIQVGALQIYSVDNIEYVLRENLFDVNDISLSGRHGSLSLADLMERFGNEDDEMRERLSGINLISSRERIGLDNVDGLGQLVGTTQFVSRANDLP